MPPVAPTTTLTRVSHLRLAIDSSGGVSVQVDGGRVMAGPHTLAILDVFSRPRTMTEALEILAPRVPTAVGPAALTDAILGLLHHGVLQDESAGAQAKPSRGYGSPRVHIAMLDDHARTAAWIRGIHEVVKADDVVVDIGTGTGVLAVAAVRAGAAKVYAIEASSIADGAAEVFQANGVADRITVLRGWSTEVTLPSRADVLVTELIGDEPLDEEVLEVLRDAKARLLKPGARVIPSHLRIFGVAASFLPRVRGRLQFLPETLARWRGRYAIDFSPLRAVVRDPAESIFFDSEDEHWSMVGEPVLLTDVDLAAADEIVVDASAEIVAKGPGRVDGVVVFFEAVLSPSSSLTTDPRHASPENHWLRPGWMLEEPMELEAGDRLMIRYRHGVTGSPNGATITRR